MIKERAIIIVELVIIVILFILYLHASIDKDYSNISTTKSSGLLSSRIYSGLLEPQSYLIFNLKPLEEEIRDYLSEKKINVSVYILNMRDGASLGINEEAEFEPASLNKLPLAIAVMKKVESRELSLSSELEIMPSDKDSSSGTLYMQNSEKITVKKLLNYLLSESDNTAFRVLARQVSSDDIKRVSFYLDFYRTGENYTYLNKYYTISAKSTYNLFSSLYLSTFLNSPSSEYLLSLLANSTFNIHKYANLSDKVIVAQKYGNYYLRDLKTFNDCGILYYNEKRFFYCIMLNGLSGDESKEVIGEIVHKLYLYLQTVEASLKT